MARLWVSGAELNDGTSGTIEQTFLLSGATIQTTIKRSGSYAYRTPNAGGSVEVIYSGSGTAHVYLRAYLYINTLPSVESTVMYDNFSRIHMTLDSSGVLRLYESLYTTLVGTSSAISTGQWHRLEIHNDATNAPGSRTFQARVDGTQFASSTTSSAGNFNGDFMVGCSFAGESDTTGLLYWDDLAANDASGSYQNSWCGAGSLVILKPNAAGDNSDGTVTPSGAAYAAMDEVTPNDATDYLSHDTTNQICDVNCDASSSAGIGASDAISLVMVGCRHAGATASNRTFKLRVKSQASGTLLESASITDGSTVWNTNLKNLDSSNKYLLVSYVDPQAGSAWTPSLLDTMQIGFQTTDASPAVRMSTIWAYVEYVPAAGGDITINTSDSITLTESNTFLINPILLNVFESVTITESVSIFENPFLINLSDSITITESITLTLIAGLIISIFDAITLTESVSLIVNPLPINLSDSITITELDSLIVNPLPINLSDSITLTESATVALSSTGILSIDIFDVITLTESIQFSTDNFISMIDSLTITELVPLTQINLISVFDAITITESISTLRISDISVFDSLTLTENTSYSFQNFINVAESITFTETVSMNAFLGSALISVTDNLTLTESLEIGSWSKRFNIIKMDSKEQLNPIGIDFKEYPPKLRSKSQGWPLGMNDGKVI